MNKINENEQGKKCFIITPIGNENSDIFRKAKGVIENVVKPVLNTYGFDDIKPAYEINISGMINTQIINRIVNDDLVVVNLTGNNPNVMYELAIRHAIAKPIIHICEKGTVLPFDIKDSRTIFFENDMLGAEELKKSFCDFLNQIDYQYEYKDNPIYNACRLGYILKESKNTEKETEIQLLVDILNGVMELKKKSKISTIYDEGFIGLDEEYTMNEFIWDIENVDKVLIKNMEILKEKMRVYELAKMWKVQSRMIELICRMIGKGVTTHMAVIEKKDIKKISDFICTCSFGD